MLWFSLLLVTVLFFFSVSVACLPFLCERNRTLTIIHKRSLYGKSAQHLAFFGAIAFFILGIALFLDYYSNGLIAQHFIIPKFLDTLFIMLATLFLLGGVFFFILQRLGKTSQNILFKFNILVGIILLGLIALLSWLYLRSAVLFKEWSLVQLWTHEPLQILFLVYMSFCVCLGFMGAHILSIVFFIMRRNRDDYGRDYYNTIITSHAKRAMYSGLLLCIPVAILAFVMPVSHEKLTSLIAELFSLGLIKTQATDISFTPRSLSSVYLYLSLFIVLIPLSVLCLQRIAGSSLPMQKKSFVFFAFQLVILGLGVLMFRLWY